MIAKVIRGALFGALLLGPSISTAQLLGTVQLTPQEMRLTALASLQEGRAARALAIAEALLVRRADDLTALRVASRAALDLGQYDVSARHGRTLYHAAEDGDTRHYAARVIALAEAQNERFTRAQMWLRRARQTAPNPAAADQVARDFAALRQRNPLHFNLEFGVSPSSNINNGSSETTTTYYGDFGGLLGDLPDGGFVVGISPDGQELSGLEVTAGAQLAYRLNESRRARTTLVAGYNARRYVLSETARDSVPDFDTADLAFDRAYIGLAQDWATADNRPISASLRFGVSTLGGELYSRDVEASFGSQWSLSENTVLLANLSLGHVEYAGSGFSADSWDSALTWRHALANADVVSFGLSAGGTDSPDTQSLYNTRTGVSVGYDFGRVWDAVDLKVELQRNWQSFRPDDFAPNGRNDIRTNATVSVGLPHVELYGFSPLVTFEATRNASNVSRHQTETTAIDLSFRSNF